MSREEILAKIKGFEEKLEMDSFKDYHENFRQGIERLKSQLEEMGGDVPTEKKPKAEKKTPPKKKATKKKATKKTTKASSKPTKDDYDKALADLQKKSGMTEEKCLEIIEEYRALRKKSQERKAKENKAKVKKNEEQKKRTDKLKEEGKLDEEGTLKPEAVIEQDTPKVEEKVEKEVEKIVEENTPKPTKDEPKPKPTKKDEKKIKQGVKEVAEDTTDAIQEMLMAILGVVKKQEPSIAKASLIKLRDALTKEINKMAYGGLTDGAVANMNVTQSQMSAESVNPQMYAKGGRMEQGYNDRMDESLGMRHRGHHSQSHKDRRDEAKGMNKAMGNRAYQSVRSMDKMAKGGEIKEIRNIDDKIIWNNKSKESFVDFAKKIYKENEEYTEKQDLPKKINSKSDAIDYLKNYTELSLVKEPKTYAKGGGVGDKVYELKSWFVDVYEDSYENGELGNVHNWSSSDYRDTPKTFQSKEELEDYIQEVIERSVYGHDFKKEYLDIYEEGDGDVNINYSAGASYDDSGYGDYNNPTKEELENWKKDNQKLFRVNFAFRVEVYQKNKLSYAKGGKMEQGYNDRMDESLGMRHRGHHSQSHKDRRDEAKGMNKGMGNRAYQSVGSMDKMKKGGSTNANWIQDVVDSPNFDKGAFTRKAKNRGMTTMELMKDVLSNPNEYTLKTRRQAQFMKNAM